MHDDDDSGDDDDAAVQKKVVATFPEMKRISRRALEPTAGKSGRGGSHTLRSYTCRRALHLLAQC